MRFGHFDDRAANTSSPRRNPVPLDQLPRVGAVLRARLASAGGYCFFAMRAYAASRATATTTSRPTRRPLLLHQRRRRHLDADVRADQQRARLLRVPSRPRLHAHHRERKGVRAAARARADGRPPRCIRSRSRTRAPRPKTLKSSLSSSSACGTPTTTRPTFSGTSATGEVEVERNGARFTTRPSIASAAITTRFTRQRRRRGLRYRSRVVHRALQRFREPEVPRQGQSRRTRSRAAGPHRVARPGREARARRREDVRVLLGYVENPREEKWEKPGVINKKRAQR